MTQIDICEIENREDILESIEKNKDIKISDQLLTKLKNIESFELVLVNKEIKNGIIIHSVEEVTDELIEKALG